MARRVGNVGSLSRQGGDVRPGVLKLHQLQCVSRQCRLALCLNTIIISNNRHSLVPIEPLLQVGQGELVAGLILAIAGAPALNSVVGEVNKLTHRSLPRSRGLDEQQAGTVNIRQEVGEGLAFGLQPK